MSSFIIKEAKIEDVSIIKSFIEKLAKYEKLESELKLSEEKLANTLFGDTVYAKCKLAFITDLTNESSQINEYEQKEIPVGFCLYFYSYSTFLAKPGIWLEDLFVLEEYRNNGIGKALLVSLIEEAKVKNFGRVEWSVLDWNTPAIDFYTKIGAVPMDEWTTWRITTKII